MSDFADGFRSGLMEAVHTLRTAAEEHRADSRASKKVLEAQAHELAAAVIGSWAEGICINANRALVPSGPNCEDCPPENYETNVTRCESCPRRNRLMVSALQSARRFLRNQDGAGFGTTKMEGSDFYMWASTIASEIDAALGESK